MAINIFDVVILVVAFVLLVAIFVIAFSFFDHKRKIKVAQYGQLKKWVYKARELDNTEERMNSLLLQHGWNKEMVEHVLRETRGSFYK